jgi:hypothetical protein
MAGYVSVFAFGKPGGFRGCDGVSEIDFILLEGTAGRMWFCVKHFTNSYSPMGEVETFIPQDPKDNFALLDALLLFAPQLFKNCPTLGLAEKQMGKKKRIDFDSEPWLITPEWRALRSEAYDIVSEMSIWKGNLQELTM